MTITVPKQLEYDTQYVCCLRHSEPLHCVQSHRSLEGRLF